MQHYAEAMLYQFPDNQIHAANDAVMRPKQRCRTVPIPSTITAIPGYPNKLAVFKIAASKFWQVRCWIKGKTHRRSTQSQSLRVAQSFARQFYELLLAKHYIGSNDADDLHSNLVSQSSVIRSSAPVKPKHTFGALAAQMFANEQCRQERGEITIESVQVMRNRLDAHILTRWAKVAPADIDYKALLDFTEPVRNFVCKA